MQRSYRFGIDGTLKLTAEPGRQPTFQALGKNDRLVIARRDMSSAFARDIGDGFHLAADISEDGTPDLKIKVYAPLGKTALQRLRAAVKRPRSQEVPSVGWVTIGRLLASLDAALAQIPEGAE